MANQVSGAKTKVMMGFETAYGVELTTPGTKAKLFQILSETFKGDQGLKASALIGSDPNPRDPITLRKNAMGDIKTYIQSKSFGYLTYWALGSVAPTGVGPYVHVIKPSLDEVFADLDEEIPFDAGSKWKRALGVACNTFTFGFKADDFAEVTFGSSCSDVIQQTAVYSATPTDYTDESSYDDKAHLAAADLKLGGSATAKILTLSGTWNWNRFMDDYRSGQSGTRNSNPKKRGSLGGTARLALEAVADWDLARGNPVTTSFEWKYSIDADTYVKFEIPRVTLSRTDPSVADDGPMFLDVNWMASKDSGIGTSFRITVGSAIASYTT